VREAVVILDEGGVKGRRKSARGMKESVNNVEKGCVLSQNSL